MQITKPHPYSVLERVTLDDGSRFYVDPEGRHLSSVTTILSATADMTGLNEWRAWVGDKKADQIRDEACALGSLMHTHLEAHIQDLERPKGKNQIRIMAENMADVVISRGLGNVTEVWGMEEILYLPGVYAGTADLIGCHNGEPCIFDYKTARKMKTKADIPDYACQLAAYALAHNALYGTDIKKGVIFMVSRDLKFEEFVFEGEEFQHATNEWLRRVEEFLSKA